MPQILEITQSEKSYLRELAKRNLEYAGLPIMEERKKLWYKHNTLKGSKPPIIMELTFYEDILPVLKCVSAAGKEIEINLLMPLVNHELINDDKVVSPFYSVYWKIDLHEFGDMDLRPNFIENSSGKKLGYSYKHPIKDLKDDFSLLKHSTYTVDREGTHAWKSFVEEVIGDIMPVKIKNGSLGWHVTPSQKAVMLMGLETMMFSMVDYLNEIHALYNFLKEDIMLFVKWQEKEGLLTLNNENDYTGAGSYGFSNELPSDSYKNNGFVTTKDIWVNMNSQETVGVSPKMYGEFIFPYYYGLAKEFGLLYYGCCEPVHAIWENYISTLPGLKKVSVSPWCDEDYMGSALKGSKVIYSRKPSPNFIGVNGYFDENLFSEHITKTLKAARGCELEFIFRDIYTLSGDTSKPGKAVKLTRDLIEKLW